MTQKAKSKQLAFASEMQDWISEERWSERLVGMVCVMAGLLNALISLGWADFLAASYFWASIALIGVYLYWRTSAPEKIHARLRQRLHQAPWLWAVGGIVLFGLAMVAYGSASEVSLWLWIPISFVRSMSAVLGMFGIQAMWRAWKLSQMQAYYSV